jgi:hypothetical protein
MDQHRVAIVVRLLSAVPSRRDLLRGLAGTGLGWGAAWLAAGGEAKRKGKPKPSLCKRDGTRCRREGNGCKAKFCLTAPFTIEARWAIDNDHDTFLYLPPQNASTGPAPYINHYCNSTETTCPNRDTYPFACLNQDERFDGSEITMISKLLEGRYEYWFELQEHTAAGDVTVLLRDRDGRLVRKWSSPFNPSHEDESWHVFDIDGKHGSVTAIDKLIDGEGYDVHGPSTDVCPYE